MYRFWVEYCDFGKLEKTEKRSEDLGKKVLPDGSEEEDMRGFMIEVDENLVAAVVDSELPGKKVKLEREIYRIAMGIAYDKCQEISHYYAPTSIELVSC